MGRTSRIASLVVCLGGSLAVSACSSGNAGLSTGTLLGGSAPAAAPTAAVETITDRALHVGATTARAQRCGYVFDPGSVRQGFLAAETQQGTAPDQVAKAEKSYDFTVASVGKSIAGEADYCDEAKTASIKRDLNQVLAGDFSAPAKKALPPSTGWWGGPTRAEPLDREKIFNPAPR